MAKVTMRKEDFDRILQAVERTAQRTNSKVVVNYDRLVIQSGSDTLDNSNTDANLGAELRAE